MNNTKIEATTTKTGTPHEIKEGLTSIIIPIYLNSYSLLHYTGHTIGSVREHTDKEKTPYEIVLVDDNSPITLPNPSAYNVDKYVKNEKNEGVTKAWNRGIRISQGEYICLLNNDVMVFNHWLEDLQACLQHLDLVMATPMYGEPFSRAVEAENKRKEWEGRMIGESFSTFKDFSCVLVKRSLFDELGLFDEIYFNYAQDSDFFKRMEAKGKKWASTKRVNTFHIIGATSTSLPETPQVMDEDKAKYAQKWEGVKKMDISQQTPSPDPSQIPAHPNPSPSVPDLEPEKPKEYTLENMPKLVRTVETGDKIYLAREGAIHWITNPKVLEGLGHKFGDEAAIPRKSFILLKRGEPITLFNLEKFKEVKDEVLNNSAGSHGLAGEAGTTPASSPVNSKPNLS